MNPDRNQGHFNLRPYQTKLISGIRSKISQYKAVLACAATGSGKSKTFITMCREAANKGTTVLVLTESSKIYRQLSAELVCHNIDAKRRHAYIWKGEIHIAMSQTLINRQHLIDMLVSLGNNLLVIADEAHIGTMTKVLLQLKDTAYIVGFTATPAYTWAKHLPKIYQDIVIGPQPDELVNGGYLAPYLHFERVVAELSNLQVGSTGEFTEDSQNDAFEKTVVYDGLFEDLATVSHSKCIIYTASIHHCNALFDQMHASGYDVIKFHSDMKPEKERDYALSQFEHGNIKYCVSVAALTKGFDAPAIDLVVLMRATTSLPLYLQMVGRGSRISKSTGKTKFTVLDYGQNYTRFGPWDMDRDWADMWNKKPRKAGVAPMKECPECGYIMHTVKPSCPNCGYIFPKQEIEIPETILVERTADYSSLRGKKISELDPNQLALYARLKNKVSICNIVALSKERQSPGFLYAYAQQMNFHETWVANQLSFLQSSSLVEYPDITLK